MMKQISGLFMYICLVLFGFQSLALAQDNSSEEPSIHSLNQCSDYKADEVFSGEELLDNALALLNHLPAPNDVVAKYQALGYEVCGVGVPLKKDIYMNHRYVGQIKITSPEGHLKLNIPFIYTSPSVQTDHVSDRKIWVALPNQNFDDILGKIKDNFVAQSQVDNFELKKAADLYTVARQQSWWGEEAQRTLSILPLSRKGDAGDQYYLLGWLETINATGTTFAQESAAIKQVYRYNKASKTLEISATDSAFNDLYMPSEDLLSEVLQAGEPQELEERSQKIQEFGSLDYLLQ